MAERKIATARVREMKGVCRLGQNHACVRKTRRSRLYGRWLFRATNTIVATSVVDTFILVTSVLTLTAKKLASYVAS